MPPTGSVAGKIGGMRLSAAGRMVLATGLLAALTSTCARPGPAAQPSARRPGSTGDTGRGPAGTARPDGGCGVPGRRLAAHLQRRGARLGRGRSDPDRRALYRRRRRCHIRRGLQQRRRARERLAHRCRVSRSPLGAEPGSDGRLRDRAGEPRRRRDDPGPGRRRSERWGPLRKPGTVVTVTGYPMGDGGGPVGCRAATAKATQGFPSLPCEGVVDGLSGAPWITGSTVTGLIGGLDGGGCAGRESRTRRHSTTRSPACSRAPRPAAPATTRRRCSTTTAVNCGTDSARAACSSRPAPRPCRPPRTSDS